MIYLRGFLPWLAFAGASSFGWQWGALAGLVLAAVLLVSDRAAGWSPAGRMLEYGTIVFFAALTVLAFVRPDSGLESYSNALSTGWLALIAWLSIAVRCPFTLAMARRMAPPEVWGSPLFRRISVVITAVWALSFTLTALAQLAIAAYGLSMFCSILVQIAAFVVPIRFTATYPDRAQARFARETGVQLQTQEA
ncbi:hypothetical protein [Streptomyces pinistramenti]|uniref:hypothetical protein n=1 Tax=Streptomyces pinistramenti TaxID=2884812 RepID=UPI001D06439E|nr:hypothetical protein [Streptomyces pinistramenti]MCB5912069.1 hypothetical protein [Streptomyces pinistramenti]